MRLEPHAVHSAVHFPLSEDGFDLVGERRVLREISDLVPSLLHEIEPLLVVVADDDARRPE